jgi:diguanylate cyclase (GGDEF)-like protein/PAS domain S-box-containing protein
MVGVTECRSGHEADDGERKSEADLTPRSVEQARAPAPQRAFWPPGRPRHPQTARRAADMDEHGSCAAVRPPDDEYHPRPGDRLSERNLLDPDDLPAWRASLLNRVSLITLGAAVIPVALVTIEARDATSWTHAVLCWFSLAMLTLLCRPGLVSNGMRAAAGCALLYLFGVWLLTRGAAVGMLYLLAFPVVLALVLHTRAGVWALLLSALSLALGGWVLELNIPMVVGLPGDSLLRWITLASNLALLGTLMTLATGYLLRQLERTLANQRHSARLLREVASQVPGMVFRVRLDAALQPRFVFVSPGSQDLLGIAPDALIADAGQLSKCMPAEEQQRLLDQLRSGIRAGAVRHDTQLRVRTLPGEWRWLQVQATEVERDGDTVVLNGVATDITARKEAEARVQRQAYTDALTGLPNRLSLQLALARALDAAQRDGGQVALLLVDLDRFKEVNDTRGHAGGDALLVQAGQRLQGCLREQGVVARVGGDEFVLLLTGPDCESAAEAVGRRVLEAMSHAFPVDGHLAFVSASVGIALHPADGQDADELLIHADQALYEAKDAGRNRCCRFSADLQARAQRRVRLAQDLRIAIERHQLSLVYQPIVELATRRVVKAEALLRWQHPELGAISPAEFVPIAESAGLIDEIGSWVFATAARQVRTWRQTLDPAFRVGINHSPLQFRSEQARGRPWSAQLAALGIPGEALIVEITEGLLLDHSDALARQLSELRASGVQVALDDFGTGYSALAYLHRYEIDLLKIDRSFVSGAAASHTGRSLCRAMVALAQELGMQVVAEGVETAEQSEWLHSIGCQHAQGWLFGKGMPAGDFERWYAAHQATVTPAAVPATPAAALPA